jgi:hypothetical protein
MAQSTPAEALRRIPITPAPSPPNRSGRTRRPNASQRALIIAAFAGRCALVLGLLSSLPQVLQRVLQCCNSTEPGPVLCFGEACLGVAGHLLDAWQLRGIDAQEPAPAAHRLQA